MRACFIAGAAVAVRAALLAAAHPQVSSSVLRIVALTPHSDPLRLAECLALYGSQASLYAGGVCREPPLYVSLYYTAGLPPWILSLTADLATALLLAGISAHVGWSTWSIWSPAVWFLASPLGLLSAAAQSTRAVHDMLLILSLWAALRGASRHSAAALALAALASPHDLFLFPALSAVAGRSPWRIALEVSIWLCVAILLSIFVTGSADFLAATWGNMLVVDDLTPNLGLYWYLFAEIFEPFRIFFLAVFLLVLLAVTWTLHQALRLTPHLLFLATFTALCLFKPYPALGDLVLLAALLAPLTTQLQDWRFVAIGVVALVFGLVLSAVTWHHWIVSGRGNANFFFSAVLIASLGEVTASCSILQQAVAAHKQPTRGAS
eukprot:m.87980 g.87980  ORF g.87980 m.87980 type:complete len:379 (-) comp8479_c0_seq1:141-1277(-)